MPKGGRKEHESHSENSVHQVVGRGEGLGETVDCVSLSHFSKRGQNHSRTAPNMATMVTAPLAPPSCEVLREGPPTTAPAVPEPRVLSCPRPAGLQG